MHAVAAAAFSVLRVSAARRDVVGVGPLWQQPHDVLRLLLLLRQIVVVAVLRPRVHADALLSVHRWLDGVVDVLRCSPLLCPPFRK